MGKACPEGWGGERNDRGVHPENCVSAHNLHVSVLEVERLVASRNPFLAVLPGVLAKFGWSQVGYRGNAQCGGGDGDDSIFGKCVGKNLHVMQDGGRLDALQDGRRDTKINRGGEILGSKMDGSFDLCRDSSGHFTHFTELTKFLVHKLVGSDGRHWDE